MIIGLTGTIGSGKGVVADYLVQKGYTYYSLSDIVREETTKMGITHMRENLQNVGNGLRRKYGLGILAERTKEKIINGRNYVIDGIRNTAEVAALRTLPRFYLIGVDSPLNIRWERVKARGRASDAKDEKEFVRLDLIDRGQEEVYGQQVGKCLSLANFQILNNINLDALYKNIEGILKTIED